MIYWIVLFSAKFCEDFPEVDWVVQIDCPEDSATYIHRVGRTARYQKGGEAIIVLTPSEEAAMLSRLESARIPIENIKWVKNFTFY